MCACDKRKDVALTNINANAAITNNCWARAQRLH
jgi:hypothetical protein